VLPDIKVQGLDQPFTYAFPLEWGEPRVGQVVSVPFGHRQVGGFVVEAQVEVPDGKDLTELKPVSSLRDDVFIDTTSMELARWIAAEYLSPLAACLHLFLPVGNPPKRKLKPKAKPEVAPSAPLDLNAEQRAACEMICQPAAEDGRPVLLDGITGSGKTEVYLQAIAHMLEQGRGAICLVPEISLTPQTVARFRARFGDAVAVLHSRMSKGERYAAWQRARRGEAKVMVGARSALFAPIQDLGLLIIDEEHEYSYKSDGAPRYLARTVAAKMCQLKGATLVLGSATPSLESLGRVSDGSYRQASLTQRATGAQVPDIQVVDLSLEFKQGNKSMFSAELKDALRQTMALRQKAILLLNRRGFANFLLCRDCGFVPTCKDCSTSLTLHAASGHLQCHTCGLEYPVPAVCPQCGSKYIARLGKGTEFAEADLHGILGPDVPIVRMDAYTTRLKTGHADRLREFAEAPFGVLLGTQMIAKGLDFPEVTLVGVLLADTTLRIPDFRAAERTYNLLEQVSGRSGRGAQSAGRVIIQTYQPRHYAIRAVGSHDRALFVKNELPLRQTLDYPPFCRLANLQLRGRDFKLVSADASSLAQLLRTAAAADIRVLGPSACTIGKVKNEWRWHLLVKAGLGVDLPAFLAQAMTDFHVSKGVRCFADVDPYDLL
jgi:primosomal protein N' (replication factor Y)